MKQRAQDAEKFLRAAREEARRALGSSADIQAVDWDDDTQVAMQRSLKGSAELDRALREYLESTGQAPPKG